MARPGSRRGSVALLAVLGGACGGSEAEPPAALTEVQLGELLFHDTNLSAERTQACATCHDPAHAFVDARLGADGRTAATSLGADGVSRGTRNTPTAAYAAFAPRFVVGTRQRHNKQNANRLYEGPLGGQFWDGRRGGLAEQAGDPPLNPIEMGMPSADAVAARILEDPTYRDTLEALYGADILEAPGRVFSAFTEAVAAYERTETFAPFDARYDRSLRGEVTLSFKERAGRALFFSQFTNCAICHQLHENGDPTVRGAETFTGYEFHNIGVPANPDVQAAPDLGLFETTADAADRGKMKTPTLRNVAVTGPYMHNGVFEDLRTTIEFYLRFVDPDAHGTNPETGAAWRAPEVPETVARDLLEVGRDLTPFEIDNMVCFLRALTDARYEHLIPEDGLDCGN